MEVTQMSLQSEMCQLRMETCFSEMNRTWNVLTQLLLTWQPDGAAHSGSAGPAAAPAHDHHRRAPLEHRHGC